MVVTTIVLAALSVPAGTLEKIALMRMSRSCAVDVAFDIRRIHRARAPDAIAGTMTLTAILFVALWRCDQV
jgi:hypothetical protein